MNVKKCYFFLYKWTFLFTLDMDHCVIGAHWGTGLKNKRAFKRITFRLGPLAMHISSWIKV